MKYLPIAVHSERRSHASFARRLIPFRSVNRAGAAGYDAGLQRHHLLPQQLLHENCFAALLAAVSCEAIGYHDFRCNGLLLPCEDVAAVRIGLPLHRGPHRDYNAMVIERVGQIERGWSQRRLCEPDRAREEALFRLRLLQGALRRRLLDPGRRPILLNRRQLAAPSLDFAELDAMADMLWCELERDPVAGAPGTPQALTAFAALSTARTLAVATSSSMPTPQIVRPSGVTHST